MSTDAAATPGPLRILLVDDDAYVCEAVAMVLRRAGHVVAAVPSGQEALDHLATNPALDMVLTDLGMPDVNGWVVARSAKDQYPTVPVGLVTGWGDDEEIAGAVQRGAIDFVITKPFTWRELTDAVTRFSQPSLAA